MRQAETVKQVDAVIVGGSLVGSAMACSLAQRDPKMKIAVIEAGPVPQPFCADQFDPRVVALTRASQQLLASLGVWDSIRESRVSPYTDMHVWDGAGTGAIEFSAHEIAQPDLGHIVENSVITQALLSRLLSCGNVELLRPLRVLSMACEDGFQHLQLDDGSSLSAPLVIAADGANSEVRQMAGIELREWDYNHQAIVTTVKTECSHDQTARQVFLQSGPLAFLPLDAALGQADDRHFSSIVWSCLPDLAEELMALSDSDFSARLERAIEHRLGAVQSVAKRYCFPLRQRHATEYYRGGVALIGDAAHTIHPLAGQGVNLGFLDVQALSDELIRARLRGLSLTDDSVLKRYQRQRKAHNLAMMGVMEGFKRLFEADPLSLRWLRNQGLSTLNRLGPVKNTLIRQAMGFQTLVPLR